MSDDFVKLVFEEFVFSKRELKKLPKPFLSFVVASCVAANDLSFFQRLYITHAHTLSNDEIVNDFINTNALIIVRNASSRLYEFIRIFDELLLKIGNSHGRLSLPNTDEISEWTCKMKSTDSYRVVESLRNKMTSHYIGSELASSIGQFRDDHSFRIFAHNITGNSLYFMGEEIGIAGKLGIPNESQTSIDSLMRWVISGFDIMLLHQKTLALIFNICLGKVKCTTRIVEVERRFTTDFTSFAPIFAMPK